MKHDRKRERERERESALLNFFSSLEVAVLGLSLNDRTILFLVILLGKTVSVV